MDPLCVDSPGEVTRLFEEWEDQRLGVNPEFADPFNLDLAPDYLHKANISGGGPYGIELPFLGADPIFVNEVHELPFVDYLRLCFRWAGGVRRRRRCGWRSKKRPGFFGTRDSGPGARSNRSE